MQPQKHRPVLELIVLYWFAQATLLLVGMTMWGGTMDYSDWLYGNPFSPEVWSSWGEPEFWFIMGVVIGGVTVAQALFLIPARKPGICGPHGRSLRMSLIMAGLAIGVLVFATILGVWGMFDEGFEDTGSIIGSMPGGGWWVMPYVCAVCWGVPTVVLFAFCRAAPRETVLSRLANRILLGTAAEVVLMIPLDVMVRRRTDCYCAEGTFFALTLAGWVGVFAAGPVVFLPLFARRRRRWYLDHCNACGYDMTSIPDAPRCPECGTGWRADAGTS